MRIFIDTSILFPALDELHPNHKDAHSFITHLEENHSIIVLNTHLIAELFRNLSSPPRLTLEQLDRIGQTIEQISDRYETVMLTKQDYLLATKRCVKLGLRGAVIYDALHFQAAIKANVDILYTHNQRDFARLLDDDIAFRVESAF